MARHDDDGSLRPTVAGVLMAAQDPRVWMPSAFVQAVAYRGTNAIPDGADNAYQLDAADIGGPLDQQIVDTCRFMVRNMSTAASKEMGRQDLPQFDTTAIFEAIVNAVAHRDYSIHGSKIRLRLFSDRLELYSPGAIANTMTVDSLAYRQSARNEAITSLLARCPVPANAPFKSDRVTLMDKRGEGVGIILENSARLSGKLPEYRLLDESELLLTIYAAQL
jgi:predicted HTH transcriptional regulator